MGLHNVGVKAHLFNALVRPVINYGCGQQLSLLATEVGWRPLSTDWLRQAARFSAKALRRPDGDLLKAAMRESWELAAGGVRESWVAQLSECLSTVGHTLVWGQEAGGIARLLETAAAELGFTTTNSQPSQ
ncbi:hypothetical protein FOA52_006441 [Chlamydomonas sp. UWO 241]|nr:hypothetical protein FOA52_006441 [Chlamydomonas sp. UWO 241]